MLAREATTKASSTCHAHCSMLPSEYLGLCCERVERVNVITMAGNTLIVCDRVADAFLTRDPLL
mgnify:CR=1 FL=1